MSGMWSDEAFRKRVAAVVIARRGALERIQEDSTMFGLKDSTYRKFEYGTSRNPRPTTLSRLTRFLEWPLDIFRRMADEPDYDPNSDPEFQVRSSDLDRPLPSKPVVEFAEDLPPIDVADMYTMLSSMMEEHGTDTDWARFANFWGRLYPVFDGRWRDTPSPAEGSAETIDVLAATGIESKNRSNRDAVTRDEAEALLDDLPLPIVEQVIVYMEFLNSQSQTKTSDAEVQSQSRDADISPDDEGKL